MERSFPQPVLLGGPEVHGVLHDLCVDTGMGGAGHLNADDQVSVVILQISSKSKHPTSTDWEARTTEHTETMTHERLS
jgi:hypothetical protein